MFDGNPEVRAHHLMLHKVFMVACHLNAMLAQFIYILIIPCVCVCVREWELPWWQPINSALGDSERRNSDSRAALVMQYGSTGIRELSYTLKVTLYVCVCPHLLFASSAILSSLPHPWGPSMKQPHDLRIPTAALSAGWEAECQTSNKAFNKHNSAQC